MATTASAFFDALNALSVAAAFGVAVVADALGALWVWESVVMAVAPEAQGKSGGLQGEYGAGGQTGYQLSAIGFQLSAKNNGEPRLNADAKTD